MCTDAIFTAMKMNWIIPVYNCQFGGKIINEFTAGFTILNVCHCHSTNQLHHNRVTYICFQPLKKLHWNEHKLTIRRLLKRYRNVKKTHLHKSLKFNIVVYSPFSFCLPLTGQTWKELWTMTDREGSNNIVHRWLSHGLAFLSVSSGLLYSSCLLQSKYGTAPHTSSHLCADITQAQVSAW